MTTISLIALNFYEIYNISLIDTINSHYTYVNHIVLFKKFYPGSIYITIDKL